MTLFKNSSTVYFKIKTRFFKRNLPRFFIAASEDKRKLACDLSARRRDIVPSYIAASEDDGEFARISSEQRRNKAQYCGASPATARLATRSFTFFFLICVSLNLLAVPFLAYAENGGAGYTPPSQSFAQKIVADQQKEKTLGTFRQYYLFMLGVVGISAFFMITWGGIQYASSMGNPGAISSAKNKIWSALAGIALAGSSYLILRLINPDLVEFRIATTDVIPPLVIDTAADTYSSPKAGADTVTFTNTCVKEGGRVITPPREGTKFIQRCVPFNSSE